MMWMRLPALLMAILLVTPAALAQTKAEKEQAKIHFRQGQAQFNLREFDKALAEFKSAYLLSNDPALLFNIGQCQSKLGDLDGALYSYRAYLRTGKDGNRSEVEERIKDLEKRLAQASPSTAPSPSPGGADRPAKPVATAAAGARPTPATAAAGSVARPPSTGTVTAVSAGGAACTGAAARLTFESLPQKVDTARGLGRAFSSPAHDRTRAWCGNGSLRVAASFSLDAKKVNGMMPHQIGEVYIPLPETLDLTNRTLSVHVYVDGPAQAEFGGQIAAYSRTTMIDGTHRLNLHPNSWQTFSHRFGVENRLFSGGTSKATDVDGVTVQLFATGPRDGRTWNATVYVDDIDWQ